MTIYFFDNYTSHQILSISKFKEQIYGKFKNVQPKTDCPNLLGNGNNTTFRTKVEQRTSIYTEVSTALPTELKEISTRLTNKTHYARMERLFIT